MKLTIVPLEERILLDAAAAATVAGGYEAESATAEKAHEDQSAHQQSAQNPDGGPMGNNEAVDGRVLVISSQIDNASQLLDAAHQNGQTSFIYDFNTSLSDLAQHISDSLNGGKASSIGFAMMGADGKFAMTSDVLVSLQSLNDNPDIQSFWKDVGGMVKSGGSIDILACNTAVNAEGLILVTQLDSLVDNMGEDHYISVNASIDKTGSADLGGNWMLEVGHVNALDRYFETNAANDWHGVLDAPYKIAEINSGSRSSSPSNFTQVGDQVFFTATTAAAGTELWVTDGTSGGTHIVKDIKSGTGNSNPENLIDLDGTLYFSAKNGSEVSLWRSDGTTAGTVQVKDIDTGANDTVASLTKVGSNLYFSAKTSDDGDELWKSDGTEAGTVLLSDIRSGSKSSAPDLFVTDGTTLYFTANNGTNGAELWKSDGTTAGTVLVKDIRSGATTSGIENMQAIGGYVYFSAKDSTSNGEELWRSDGTAAGTVMVKDIQSGTGSSTPSNFTAFAGKVFFTATTTTSGIELYSTDGTDAGTTMVKEIALGNTSSTPTSLTVAGGKLFFAANDVTNGIELWATDGTSEGTALVKNVNSGSLSSDPISLVAVGSKVYFAATDAAGGNELWVSDGTSVGTVQVANMNAGTANGSPADLTLIGNVLYFSATDGTTGTELWAYDTNNPPVGINKAYSGSEDTVLTVSEASGVLNGASDSDGNAITAVLVANATKGTVALNSNGSFSYTPNENVSGTDTFTYQIKDQWNSLSAVYTATLTIGAVNDAPVVASLAATTAEDVLLTGTLSATDVDSSTLTYSVVTGPAHGTLSLNPDTGAYTYTPALNYNGSDSFTFRANGGTLNSNTATVNLTVTAVNDAPVAQDGAIATNEDTVVSGSVSFSDLDTGAGQLVASVEDQPAHGTLEFNADGTYTYTPDANYNGTDSFIYKVSDGVLDNIKTLAITINAVNDAPVAQDGAIATNEDTVVSGLVAFTDIETPINQLVASVVDQPAHGILEFNGDGTYTYTPDANYNGTDSFTYKVSDGVLDSGIQTITITINAVNDAPVAQDGAITTNEDTVVSGSVAFTDIETPIYQLVASVVDQPAHGTLVFYADGTYTYTADANYNGTESFTYKVSDGNLFTDVKTVTITVKPAVDTAALIQIFKPLETSAPSPLASVEAENVLVEEAAPAPLIAVQNSPISEVSVEVAPSRIVVNIPETQDVLKALLNNNVVDSTAIVNSFENYPVKESLGSGFQSITAMKFIVPGGHFMPFSVESNNAGNIQKPILLARDSLEIQHQLTEALLLPTAHLTVVYTGKETQEERALRLLENKKETARQLKQFEMKTREGITVAAFAVSEDLQSFLSIDQSSIGKTDSREARAEILKAILEEQDPN